VEPPRTARGGSSDDLLELAQLLRRELALREEGPTGDFVESLATGLRSGEKVGWYYPTAAGGGLATTSLRGTAAYAHVHVATGPGDLDRAEALSEAVIAALPVEATSICIGFTGLTTADEDRLLERLDRRPGSTPIRRYAMERILSAEDAADLPPLPSGVVPVPIRDVTIDALADLDLRAFAGSIDELLTGSGVGEYRRALEAMLAGEFGAFLDHASTAIYRAEPPGLIGGLLTCENSSRRAVFLDFMVDPRERGRGYGSHLLRWGFRALWALGYERVRLWVSESNRTARRLYDQLGFTVTHRAVIYRWDRGSPAPQPHSDR
jgi:ribosomal protein S18 acetylase RimI-like enzyme